MAKMPSANNEIPIGTSQSRISENARNGLLVLPSDGLVRRRIKTRAAKEGTPRGKKRGGRAAKGRNTARETESNTDTVAPPTARGWYIGTGTER